MEESENIAQELNAESNNVLVNAAVMKARRLAAPNEVLRGSHRKIYRPGALEKDGIDRDSGNLLSYHRSKLRYLLSVLLQQRKWHQASGVLGVLLKIPYESLTAPAVAGRWSDFAAAVEVMRRVDSVDLNDLRLRRMFRVLSLQQPNTRSRAKVQLELALYLISVGDREAAYDELRPIVDGKYHREDPVVNLCHGLNSYYLWYEKCVEEVSRQALTGIRSRLENEGSLSIEGTGESIAPETDDQTIYHGRMKTSLKSLGDSFRLRDSHGSSVPIQLDWNQPQFEDSSAAGMELDANIWQASQRSIYEETDEQGFLQPGEELWRGVIIPWSPELDPQLFPIRVHRDVDQKHYMVPMSDGRTRDLHTAAVKHLKQALAIAPEILPALLPLVQLLLAVHDIKGAVDAIDKCSQVLKKHFIPPSLKVALLESLDKKDPIQLAACHRDVLTRNPLSLSSLRGLFNLHASGNLETAHLLECICLNLDVSPGTVETWKKLASCFLEVEGMQQLKNSGGDLNLGEGNVSEHIEDSLRRPTLLSRANLQQLWSNRHSYWLRKHFSTEGIGGEHLCVDEWLLAYKGACAAHIYGSKVEFVEHVLRTFENQGKHGELHLVEHHCERALELFEEYSNTGAVRRILTILC
ncbi:unnamed protein product [Calypogeia fissa]